MCVGRRLEFSWHHEHCCSICHVALGRKMLVEAVKQLLDQPGPGQLLAE